MIHMAHGILLITLPLFSVFLVLCNSKKSSRSAATPTPSASPAKDPLETNGASTMTSFPYKEVEEKTIAPLVSIYPTKTLEFPPGKTSQKRVTIKNLTKNSVLYSIQPSDEENYRTAPVSGILAANASVNVIVTHTPSEPGEEKLVIINSEAPRNVKEKHVADMFKGLKPTGGNVEVTLKAN